MQDPIKKDIDKMIRKILLPSLIENGFSKMKGQNTWGWHDNCIWVCNIRPIGMVHSYISNWPAESLVVYLGIYYSYLPHVIEVKKDESGMLYPKEYECSRRAQMICSYDQLQYTKDIKCNSSEKKRKDIWWVQPDGSNLSEVISDINNCFLKHAVKWFEEKSNKELTMQESGRLNGYFIEHIGGKDGLVY